jgi:hypothetical protein
LREVEGKEERKEAELGLAEVGLDSKVVTTPIRSQFNHELELDFEFKHH